MTVRKSFSPLRSSDSFSGGDPGFYAASHLESFTDPQHSLSSFKPEFPIAAFYCIRPGQFIQANSQAEFISELSDKPGILSHHLSVPSNIISVWHVTPNLFSESDPESDWRYLVPQGPD